MIRAVLVLFTFAWASWLVLGLSLIFRAEWWYEVYRRTRLWARPAWLRRLLSWSYRRVVDRWFTRAVAILVLPALRPRRTPPMLRRRVGIRALNPLNPPTAQ